MRTCSDASKKTTTEDSKCFILFIVLNKSYMLQINFAKTQGQHYEFQFLILAFNSNKYSVCFISTGKASENFGPK